MARNIIGIIVGLTAAFFMTWGIQMINYSLFPMPEGLEVTDTEAMKKYVAGLPMTAYIIVLLSHILGAFVGAWVGSVVADSHERKISIGIGSFLLIMGLINLLSIPHPVWFIIVDLLVFIPSALLGHALYTILKNRSH